MTEEPQYYTSELSELFIGYELQVRNTYFPPGTGWGETKPLDKGLVKFILTCFIPEHLVHLRTKYLDKADIESQGWTDLHELPKWRESQATLWGAKKGNVMIGIDFENHIISIMPMDPTKSLDGLKEEYEYPPKVGMFRGYCKSINEFKKVMEMLGISSKS